MAQLIQSVSSNHVILTMMLIFTAAESIGHSDAFTINHVYLKNGLGPNKVLSVRCKDVIKDKYLTLKQIPPFRQADIQYIPEQEHGGSRFDCSFLIGSSLRHFMVYDYYRDNKKCGGNCCWIITQQGPCSCSGTNKKCYPDWKL